MEDILKQIVSIKWNSLLPLSLESLPPFSGQEVAP